MSPRRAVPPRPAPEPLDTDEVRVVGVGTVLWGIAFVTLLAFREKLADAGRDWWIWTALAGFGLGLLGLEYCRRRRDALAASREHPPKETLAPPRA